MQFHQKGLDRYVKTSSRSLPTLISKIGISSRKCIAEENFSAAVPVLH